MPASTVPIAPEPVGPQPDTTTRHHRPTRRRVGRGRALAAAGAALVASTLVVGSSGPAGASRYAVNVVDATASPGWYNSMQLDAAGNPVIAHQASLTEDLRILRCDDPTCSGGGERTETPVSIGRVGQWNSLQLDGNGNPIVAYYDVTAQRLRVLRCDDPFCAPGGDTIATPDPLSSSTQAGSGRFASLQLNALGHPVIAYRDDADTALKLLVCDDPACLGGGETVRVVDTVGTAGNPGYYASLQLDASGNPVIAHHDENGGDLLLLRCDDPTCAPGGDTITTPDTSGVTGRYPSLRLDQAGNPIIAYMNPGALSLSVLRCDDPACAPGGDTITTPDPALGVGAYTSMQLDSLGNPVISYYDYFRFDLRVVRCGDPGCTAASAAVETVDSAGTVGEWSSLQLGVDDGPIVAYRSETGQSLKVASFGSFPYPLPACALAWWSGGDTTAAEVGLALTGSTGYADGVVGRGFDLDPGDTLAIDGFPALADAVSVEMWVRPVQTGLTQTLISRWDFPSTDDSARTFVLRLSPFGRLEFGTDEVTRQRPQLLTADAPQLYDGGFHHVAATFDGATAVLYVDGAEVASSAVRGGQLNPAATTQFRIGSEGTGAARFPYTGVIDEPAVYSCALTPDEVAGIAAAGSDGKA